MSPRKTILRELSRAQPHDGEGPSFTRPSSIAGFAEQPDKYQKAVNDLLQARLVEGRRDAQGHMTIALNQHRMSDVRRELRPLWARPTVWVVIVLLVAAMGAGLVS
jgi:hypothetical protein